MAAAANVSFDVLLGGKITPETLKALKDMEEKLKTFRHCDSPRPTK